MRSVSNIAICLLMLDSCVGLRILQLPAQISQSGNTYKLIGKWTKGAMDPNSFVPSECAGANLYQYRSNEENLPENAAYNFLGCCQGATHDAVFPVELQFLELLKRWANKRIGFFGDSITQEFIQAIAIGAEHHGIKFERIHQNWFKIPAYNITIARRCERQTQKECWKEKKKRNSQIEMICGRGVPSCGVVSPLPRYGDLSKSTYPTPPEFFEASLEHSDIFYMNVGLHLVHENEEVQKKEFQYIRDTMERHLTENPGKQLFFRLTLPQHFAGPEGAGIPYDLQSNSNKSATSNCVGYGSPAVEHASSFVARAAFAGSRVKILDLFDFASTRGDLHSTGSDCTHHCWNYEMWKGIWFLMANALD